MPMIDSRYIAAVNLARKNLNVAIDELLDASQSDEEETPQPAPTSQDDTDALVAAVMAGK